MPSEKPDWSEWGARLSSTGADGIDDLVDALASQVLERPPSPAATPYLARALDAARSDLSQSRVASAIVWAAASDDTDAVDCLERAFDRNKGNAFLSSSLLGALGILALRSPSARAGAARYLLRLKDCENRYLLIAGAKVIGLLCDREEEAPLRNHLLGFTSSGDVAVRAEARQQAALLRFGDALLAEQPADLTTRLAEARCAFAIAESSEELRPDAAICGLMIDLVLQFDALEVDRQTGAAAVADLTGRLRAKVGGLGDRVFQGNRSSAAVQFAATSLKIAEALESASGEVAKAVRWTTFDESVRYLAQCYTAIRYAPDAFPGQERIAAGMSGIADRVLKPRLGPVLMRKVGRESLAQVVENYRQRNGKDDILAGLLVLQEAELEAEREPGRRLSEEKHGKLAAIAAKVQQTPDDLVDRMYVVVQEGQGVEWAVGVGLLPRSSLAAEGARGMSPKVGIITVLPEEFDAVRVMVTNERRHRADGPGGSREYLLGEVPSTRGGKHQVAIAQTAQMGNSSAALRASKLLEEFGDTIDVIIMCGIAGGVPNLADVAEHVRLGDIVVPNRVGVIQYDFGKQREKDFDHRHLPRPPSARLMEAVQMLEQERFAGRRPWDQHLHTGLAARDLVRPDESTDVVFNKAGQPAAHPVFTGPRPRVFSGPIASANCVQGDHKKRDKLRDLFKIKAVEMEASGIAEATWEFEKAGYLIVRGICDYCDDRNKGSQTDKWKAYAAMAAAAYVRALLEMIPGE